MMKKLIDSGVLYVEDDLISFESVKRVLEDFINPFYFANDGEKGLDLFKKHRPKIVISDIKMPHMDGLDMVREIKKIDKDVIIFLTTAYSDEQYTIAAIEMGVNRFFLKPLKLTKIIEDLTTLNEELTLKLRFDKTKQLLEQYQEAIDSSMIVTKTDTKGIITYVNDKFCEVSGYSKEELIGSPHSIIRHPAVPSSIFKTLWEELKRGNIWQGIVQNRKKDGSSYYVKTMIFPLKNLEGKNYEYIAFRWDITQQIEHEKELEELRGKESVRQINKAITVGTKTNISTLPLMAFGVSQEGIVLHISPKLLSAIDPLGISNFELEVEKGTLHILSLLRLIDNQFKEFNSVVELIDLIHKLSPFSIHFTFNEHKKESYELLVQSGHYEEKKYFSFFIIPLSE